MNIEFILNATSLIALARRSVSAGMLPGLLWILVFLGSMGEARGANDAAWDNAVHQLQQAQNAEAVLSFSDWITTHESAGISSPEAHYNLALAYWNQKRPDGASFHLIRSAELHSAPLALWEIWEKLAGLEKEIGIREGVSSYSSFRLYLAFNRTWIVVLLTLSFWGSLGLLFIRRSHRKFLRQISPAMLLGVPVVFAVAAGVALLNQTRLNRYGVLTSQTPVPLSRSPEGNADSKLADLPPGTIVSLAVKPETAGTWIRIHGPLAGWVPLEQVRVIPTP